MHNYSIKDKYDKTLKDYLYDSCLPIPYNWNDNNMTIFDKACYGIIPDITGHKSDE